MIISNCRKYGLKTEVTYLCEKRLVPRTDRDTALEARLGPKWQITYSSQTVNAAIEAERRIRERCGGKCQIVRVLANDETEAIMHGEFEIVLLDAPNDETTNAQEIVE